MKPDWNRRFAAGRLAILLSPLAPFHARFCKRLLTLPRNLCQRLSKKNPPRAALEPEGVPITPKGNATLVDDFYGDKQLITVTTKAGIIFTFSLTVPTRTRKRQFTS